MLEALEKVAPRITKITVSTRLRGPITLSSTNRVLGAPFLANLLADL
jgi:hypothetical protein